MRAAAAAALVLFVADRRAADAYCNSAAPDGTGKKWPPVSSTEFKPGWNGLAQTPFTVARAGAPGTPTTRT